MFMLYAIGVVATFVGCAVIDHFGLPIWVLVSWIAMVGGTLGYLQALYDEEGNRQALADLRKLFAGGNRTANFARADGRVDYFEIRQVEKHSG